MKKSLISVHSWKLLIGLALVSGCCSGHVDETPVVKKADPPPPASTCTSEKESSAEQALRAALLVLAKADQADDDDDEDDDDAKAIADLRQAVESLKAARSAPPCESHAKDCCKPHAPQNCPPTKPCTDAGDAYVVVLLPAIESRNPSFTAKGAYAFTELFSAAVARGVENATIRAMNATKVYPIPPCDPQESPQPPEESSE